MTLTWLSLLALGLTSLALGLLAVVLSLGWVGPKWWLAHKATRGVDVEYALLLDEFGGDGLWP